MGGCVGGQAGVIYRLSVFDALTPRLKSLLTDSGMTVPTPPQERCIPVIMKGSNVLLVSPTGSGKTEAAMIPILDVIIRESLTATRGIKALYVTPLRALNRDLLGRLENWCKELDIRLSVRHGDTAVEERRAQSLAPPDIVITTPETLQVLLVSRRLTQYLSPLKWVVVDEIHELATDKRGSQLSVCLERLRERTDGEFQRIGLSATVGSPEVVASFLVGPGRRCEVVEVSTEKKFEFVVVYPEANQEDRLDSERMQTFPEVAARIKLLGSLIEKGPAIVFTNTRSEAEILSSRLRLWNPKIRLAVHHGSLSRGARSMAETSLKLGDLKAIVSTSSLEMGIDVGSVKLIVQYGSPRQVTRLVQRAGRSGHTLSKVSRCFIITQDSDDTLEAAAIAEFARKGKYEETSIHEKPYDVLIQQLAGLLIERRSWTLADLLTIFRRSYVFRNLTESEVRRAVEFMSYMRPRLLTIRGDIVARAFDVKPLFRYYFENLSMIPETRQYPVVSRDSTHVGMLDEDFVAKEGEIGKKFILGGSAWVIEQVYKSTVYVTKSEDSVGAVPSWVGEEIPVPTEVAQKVGFFRRSFSELAREKGGSAKVESWFDDLSRECGLSHQSSRRAFVEILEHISNELPVPSDNTVTVESWRDMVIIHTHWGLRVNRTLSRLLARTLSENRRIVSSEDAYRVVLEGKGLTCEDVASQMTNLAFADLESVLKNACEESGFFRVRFMHVARKMGVLGREADLTSGTLDRVMAAYKDGLPFEEAWRTFLHEDVDVRGASRFLSKLASGEIKLEIIGKLDTPTPLASVALEEMARKGEVMDPNRLKRLAVEGARVRASGRSVMVVCVNCWKYNTRVYLSDLPERPKCPLCSSPRIAVAPDEAEERVERLVRRLGVGMEAGESRIRLRDELLARGRLVERYGLMAVTAFALRLKVGEAEQILSRHAVQDDDFFSDIVEAERRRNLKRFFG
jgi:ATP-dependent Lhr-like helicase